MLVVHHVQVSAVSVRDTGKVGPIALGRAPVKQVAKHGKEVIAVPAGRTRVSDCSGQTIDQSPQAILPN